MASDVIDAEFALSRCHLSSTERIFFSFAVFAKNVAIDLKCIENHGGKLWLTPQLPASCKWSSFRDCQGIFRIVARKDSRRLALDFQTLRPIM